MAAPTANTAGTGPIPSVPGRRFGVVNANFEHPSLAAVTQPRAVSRNGNIGLDDNVYQALLQNRIIFWGPR